MKKKTDLIIVRCGYSGKTPPGGVGNLGAKTASHYRAAFRAHVIHAPAFGGEFSTYPQCLSKGFFFKQCIQIGLVTGRSSSLMIQFFREIIKRGFFVFINRLGVARVAFYGFLAQIKSGLVCCENSYLFPFFWHSEPLFIRASVFPVVGMFALFPVTRIRAFFNHG